MLLLVVSGGTVDGNQAGDSGDGEHRIMDILIYVIYVPRSRFTKLKFAVANVIRRA